MEPVFDLSIEPRQPRILTVRCEPNACDCQRVRAQALRHSLPILVTHPKAAGPGTLRFLVHSPWCFSKGTRFAFLRIFEGYAPLMTPKCQLRLDGRSAEFIVPTEVLDPIAKDVLQVVFFERISV